MKKTMTTDKELRDKIMNLSAEIIRLKDEIFRYGLIIDEQKQTINNQRFRIVDYRIELDKLKENQDDTKR